MVIEALRLDVGAQPSVAKVRSLDDQHGAQVALLVD